MTIWGDWPLHTLIARTATVGALLAGSVFGAGEVFAQAHAQIRIANYNIARLYGEDIELRKVFTAAADDLTPNTGVIRTPDVWVFQEVNATQPSTILDYLNGSVPPNIEYALATFTANGGGGGEQALFYRTDSIAEDVAGHKDITNHSGPRATDRWRLYLVDDPEVSFYIYGSHLKANTGSDDQRKRESEATAIRADADLLGEGVHIIYSGDYNVYSPSEGAFLRFFDPGPGFAVDPRFNRSFSSAVSHTQSPHDGSNGNLTYGGMDDRFDFQLSTEEFNDGIGLDVIEDSYRTFGNDGYHYNLAINDGENYYFWADEQWKADALAVASDHLPVVVDYWIPTPRFHLNIGFLIGGQQGLFRARDAQPNQNVYFIYSLSGLGQTYVSQLDITLRLDRPVLMGSDQANGNGTAELLMNIPSSASGLDVWLQAAQFGHTTDVILRTVQ